MAYLRNEPPAFVFLIHPRDGVDLHNGPGATLLAQYSKSEEEFQEKMLSLPPTFSGEVTFGFDSIRGETLVVFSMPENIIYSTGRAQIEEAVRVAASRGTRVIGLGALTAPATRGGLTLVPNLPKGITLTTGNAFTAAVARSNVVEAAQARGLGTDAVVAVVGCTGSVGVAAARLLDRLGFRLTLVGRSVTRVHKELADLVPHSTVSGTINDVAGADVILLLTGDRTAQITPDLPKPGAVVLDLAHPVNIPKEDYPMFALRDVEVVQGGLALVPGYRCTQEMRLPDRHCTLACLTETYLFAKAGITEHSVGPANVELAIELEHIAAQYGVRPRPLGLAVTSVVAA